MVVFTDGFINETFPVLPDRLSTSQEVYLEQFKFIQRKCEAYLIVIHKLHYLISIMARDCRICFELYDLIVEIKEKFEGYEQISPLQSEYCSVTAGRDEAIKQLNTLKLTLEQRKNDLALLKKQHQSKGAKDKAKRSDKNSRKEIQTLESQVKNARAEVSSAEKSLSCLQKRIAELKQEARERELQDQAKWETIVAESYDNFRQYGSQLLETIRKIEKLTRRPDRADRLASVCITQKDIDAEKDKCPICWREYAVGENVKACGYCKQYFDESCLGSWLEEHQTCPLCRQSPWVAI